jgi:ribokinase
VDVLTPNAVEAAGLAGLERADPEQAARGLAQHGVRAAVLTLGAEGALVLENGQLQRVPGFQVTPVDTTAAGDAFNAALAFALARGLDLAAAARVGCAAGALAATKPGAQPSLPSLDDVLQYLRAGSA